MSFLYKFFGIPRTFDEFLDKIDKRLSSDVDIYVRGQLVMSTRALFLLASPLEYRSEFGVRSDSDSVRLGHIAIKIPLKHSNNRILHVGETIKQYLDMALGYSEMLNYFGYNTTINGEPVERAKQKANFLEAKINSSRDSLADLIQ